MFTSNSKPTDRSKARKRIVERLYADLIGPLTGVEEVLTSRPSDVYLSGILWPPKIGYDPEDDDQLETASTVRDGAVDNNTDSGIAASSMHKPSVAGVSFCVASVERINLNIEVCFGRYSAETKEGVENATEWHRKEVRWSCQGHLVPPNSRNAQTWHGRELPDDLEPLRTASRIDLGKRVSDARGAELYIRTVSSEGVDLVTVSLINNSQLPKDSTRIAREERTFFQTRVTIRPGLDTRLIPKPPRLSDVASGNDDNFDELSGALLYRKAHEFAIGHVCSAEWAQSDNPGDAQAETAFVATSWMPSAIVPSVSSLGHGDLRELSKSDSSIDVLDAKFLSEASPKQLHKSLISICDAYEAWIENRIRKVSDLSPKYTDTAYKNLSNCRSVLERMKAAAVTICDDERLRNAFQLANLAMLIQHGWGTDSKNHEPLRWRPFQLAFIILSAPSTAMRLHVDRKVMDLLWFPTGGGKTEAYLGLIALTAFYRRLSNNEEDCSGVVAIMRYTLRLLTTQQFARSAAMVIACELIRKGKAKIPSRPVIQGQKPFSIGLWVGGEASPNRRAEALASLSGARELASPKQLTICPCCKERLVWPQNGMSAPVQPVCESKDCELSGPLPVWTVDDDVYDQQPTLLVGTIDKFAQIVRKPEVARLFACSSGAPPDLIIQDELHLISGPLGTVAGLYESAIDLMFSSHGHRPKIIGSTATIKRASEQVEDLFDREACQFPPPGIDEGDSGFATHDRKAEGRRYIGITTAGRSAKFTLQAVAASLLQSALASFASDEERDPYQTLVGYFNSLRELGGALVLMQDDVADTISLIAQARKEPPRRIGVVEELTSRRTQEEVLKMLEGLAIQAGQPGCIDTVLATNMVSVGVDISRLGLMLVNGQPKTSAEYIQATSRVGRREVGGLVVTILNNSKARDRSHFEAFCGWHNAFYRDVEATSVTPFASRARDRALHAALVAAVRHLVPGMLDNPTNAEVHEKEIMHLIDEIVDRANRIDPEETEVRDELVSKYEQWIAMAPDYYWNDFQSRRSLLQSAEQYARNIALGRTPDVAWPTLNSMRNVETGTPFRLARALRRAGSDSEQ